MVFNGAANGYMKTTFKAHKRNGRLIIQDSAAFNIHLDGLPEGKPLVLSVEQAHIRHRRKQENYRWGVVYPIVLMGLKQSGWHEFRDKYDVHELVKRMFLKGSVINEATGEVLETTQHTSTLSLPQETAFTNRIIEWAKEYLGVDFQEPGTQTKMEIEL